MSATQDDINGTYEDDHRAEWWSCSAAMVVFAIILGVVALGVA